MAPRRHNYKFHTKFTPYYINTTTPCRKRPSQRILDTITDELRTHLAAARILIYSKDIPFWCHPTNGKRIALTQKFVDNFLARAVRRWVRVGVESMEELDRREIGELRSVVDTLVEGFLGIDDLYATVPQGAEDKVERTDLEVTLIESVKDIEVKTE